MIFLAALFAFAGAGALLRGFAGLRLAAFLAPSLPLSLTVALLFAFLLIVASLAPLLLLLRPFPDINFANYASTAFVL
jgi:hypothetical protein